jgi:hypothetical protein
MGADVPANELKDIVIQSYEDADPRLGNVDPNEVSEYPDGDRTNYMP